MLDDILYDWHLTLVRIFERLTDESYWDINYAERREK